MYVVVHFRLDGTGGVEFAAEVGYLPSMILPQSEHGIHELD